MKRKLFLLLLLVAFCSHAFAHMLWLETAVNGVKGRTQEVKVYYGEYTEHHPEKIADWYSDVKEFKLWLTGPDQQKTQLTVTPAGDHFVATFTPATDGVYTLSVSHDAKELGGDVKYQFNASALVYVGKTLTGNNATFNPNDLSVYLPSGSAFQVGRQLSLAGFLKHKPAEKLNIEVFSPSGWNRVITTNGTGIAGFEPLWPGRYVVEASGTYDEAGEHHGKPYKQVWRCATIGFDVKK